MPLDIIYLQQFESHNCRNETQEIKSNVKINGPRVALAQASGKEKIKFHVILRTGPQSRNEESSTPLKRRISTLSYCNCFRRWLPAVILVFSDSHTTITDRITSRVTLRRKWHIEFLLCNWWPALRKGNLVFLPPSLGLKWQEVMYTHWGCGGGFERRSRGEGLLVQGKASKSLWIIECLERALDGEVKGGKVGKKRGRINLARLSRTLGDSQGNHSELSVENQVLRSITPIFWDYL
jgi:hypothetical protein